MRRLLPILLLLAACNQGSEAPAADAATDKVAAKAVADVDAATAAAQGRPATP